MTFTPDTPAPKKKRRGFEMGVFSHRARRRRGRHRVTEADKLIEALAAADYTYGIGDRPPIAPPVPARLETWRCAHCRRYTMPSRAQHADECDACGTRRPAGEIARQRAANEAEAVRRGTLELAHRLTVEILPPDALP